MSTVDRVVLLGGFPIIVRLAEWLKDQGKNYALVMSPRHAAEVFDGEKISDTAKRHGITFTSAADLNSQDALDAIGDTSTSVSLSLGAAWIFKPAFIAKHLSGRLFNSHGSRLPQNRGGGGFSWQILMGSRLGFNAIHEVDGGVDTGDIVAFREFLYPAACRVPEDFQKHYEERNLQFVQAWLADIFGGQPITRAPQPEHLSTYWPRLSTDVNGWIDWTWQVTQLERFICAFDRPYSGARTFWGKTSVRLKSVWGDYSDPMTHPFQNAIVIRNNGKWLTVACTGGTLIVEEVLDEAGNNCINSLKNGDRFFTPPQMFAGQFERVVFTPTGIKQS